MKKMDREGEERDRRMVMIRDMRRSGIWGRIA